MFPCLVRARISADCFTLLPASPFIDTTTLWKFGGHGTRKLLACHRGAERWAATLRIWTMAMQQGDRVTYEAPTFQGTAFNCPHCGAYAHMTWYPLFYQIGGWRGTGAYIALCSHCDKSSLWRGTVTRREDGSTIAEGHMVYPSIVTAPAPHPAMPVEITGDYEEARNIAQQSPRAAAALLRLCVQKLCVHLGEPGQNINADIAALVRKGLPEQIQQSLDVVRVVGNNAVHPGQMSNDDVAEVCNSLFGLVNYIVEDRIARPATVRSLYEAIPQSLRDAISRRDGNPEDSTA